MTHILSSMKNGISKGVSILATTGAYSVKGLKTVVRGTGTVVSKTANLGYKAIKYVTVPNTGALGTVSTLSGTAVSGALFNWGPVIMAQGIINGTVAAGAQWGIPAGLCRLGAGIYISAVGVPNLPNAAIAAGGLAATCVVVGIGNAVIDLAAWGKGKSAQETMSQLEELAEKFAKDAEEICGKVSEAEKRFRASYLLANEQMALVQLRQAAAEAATDPQQKVVLEEEINELLQLVDQVTLKASKEQSEYLQLSSKAKEVVEMSGAAKFALIHAKSADLPTPVPEQRETVTVELDLSEENGVCEMKTIIEQLSKDFVMPELPQRPLPMINTPTAAVACAV